MTPPVKLHFVTLLGSLRKQSVNAAIARTLPELAPEGVTIEPLASIGDLPHYDADLQDQGIPPAVLEMAETIRQADGVIIVSPEYNYSVPGVLKNAIDWLSRISPPPLAGKPLAIQSASPGLIGGARMQYHLRQSLVFLDARVLNKPEVMVSAAHGKVDGDPLRLVDPPTRDHIAKQLAALAALASS